jgi:aspartyl/asparaginyl-tRNA synthetase
VKDLEESLNGQDVWIRGRVHASRATGKNCFLTLRETFATVQAVISIQ